MNKIKRIGISAIILAIISSNITYAESNKIYDLNNDKLINEDDLSIITQLYNIKKDNERYNSAYDFNNDGIIDIYDITKLSQHIGQAINEIWRVGYVNTETLNVRSGPGTNYKKVGEVYYGNKVEIVENRDDNWYKIKYLDGYAYVYKDYISFNEPGASFKNTLDFYVNLEMKNLNLTDSTGKWVDATYDEVKYYMNPDNFVNNDGKYMFIKLNYIDGISVDAINEIIYNKGILSGKGASFLEGAKKYNINPIYLACHARLESGNGNSTLARGVWVDTVDGKPVEGRYTYNMFGIGALDSNPVRYGSEYAYKQGWFTPEKAIVEGGQWISNNYINSNKYNQNTVYKMRWNLDDVGVVGHQYASDIGWSKKQAIMMAPYFKKSDNIDFEFIIPTFKSTLRNKSFENLK